MRRSPLVCLEHADTGLREILKTRGSVITQPARLELDKVLTAIASARAELSTKVRFEVAADAVTDAYRRVIEVQRLTTGPGLQTDFAAILEELEAAGDGLGRPLHVPDA